MKRLEPWGARGAKRPTIVRRSAKVYPSLLLLPSSLFVSLFSPLRRAPLRSSLPPSNMLTLPSELHWKEHKKTCKKPDYITVDISYIQCLLFLFFLLYYITFFVKNTIFSFVFSSPLSFIILLFNSCSVIILLLFFDLHTYAVECEVHANDLHAVGSRHDLRWQR